MQNIVAKIGITYRLMTKNTDISKLFIPFQSIYHFFTHSNIHKLSFRCFISKNPTTLLIEVTLLVKERFSNNYSMSAQVVRSENSLTEVTDK